MVEGDRFRAANGGAVNKIKRQVGLFRGQLCLLNVSFPPIPDTDCVETLVFAEKEFGCLHHIRRFAVELARERSKPLAQIAKDLRVGLSG